MHPPKLLHNLAEGMDELLRVRNHAHLLAIAVLSLDAADYEVETLRHDAKVLLDRIEFANQTLDSVRA